MIEWIEQHPEELQNIREAKLNWWPGGRWSECGMNWNDFEQLYGIGMHWLLLDAIRCY